ncbi:MAG: sigma-54-dependent Fis family transcriptional regulator, partial [Rhodobacteraceae bacterium]|nr:sigma-54-dependent Fis family transcriptional regulator [Paracoccaceae bacterium]
MRLLIIGSLGGQIGAASRIAMQRGAKVLQADSIAQGLEIARGGQGTDVIMADVTLDLAELIDGLKSERINVPVVACGIENDPRAAVSAIKAGAKEYVPLPPDAELIAAVLQAVAEENDVMVYRDPAMDRVMDMAKKVAGSQASVLITGESGTGKELVARFLHRSSPRKDRPFVAVNCAAIPGELLESELFGHERGAFTGAVARRIGKFEESNGGTLLLDEISEMDLKLQAKLLRAIQEREIVRIGSNAPVKVDVRIVATSNRNMEETVKAKQFREDLYFR